LELNAPGTFSQTAKVGYIPLVAVLISLMILAASKNSTERSSSNPSLFPAIDKPWQGLPNVMQSTGSILSP
jgi:hypothetical protein